MGYTQSEDLRSLFDDTVILEWARRVTERMGDRLLELVTEFTPVSKPQTDPGTGGPVGGRVPGTLRRSWRLASLISDGRSFHIEVYTDQRTAPYIEFPTSPHLIRPKTDRAAASVVATGKPRQRGDGARLRFVSGGRVIYAREVHHPGTKGAYMMTRALAVLEEEWPVIAREELSKVGAFA